LLREPTLPLGLSRGEGELMTETTSTRPTKSRRLTASLVLTASMGVGAAALALYPASNIGDLRVIACLLPLTLGAGASLGALLSLNFFYAEGL
jgi:hypothetical protein